MNLEQTLIDLELVLLKPEIRKSKEELNKLIHDDFVEISQSGRTYSKAEALEDVPQSVQIYEATNFNMRLISDDVAQIRYKTRSYNPETKVEKHALRSSLWKHEDGRWQMIFHQGTICK